MQKPQLAITPRMDNLLTFKGPEDEFCRALQEAKWICDFSTSDVQGVTTPNARIVYGPGTVPFDGEVTVESGFENPLPPLRHRASFQGRYLRVLSDDAIVREVNDSAPEVLRICKR
jgi:hypothetical protein